MGAETSTLELCDSLQDLLRCMDELLRLVRDNPYEHAIARRYEDEVNDQLGWLHETNEKAVAVHQLASEGNYRQSAETLTACVEPLERVMASFYHRLQSYAWLDDLHNLGSEHPEDWYGWVASIQATLDQCEPMAAARALMRCWQNFAILGLATGSRSIQETRPALAG